MTNPTETRVDAAALKAAMFAAMSTGDPELTMAKFDNEARKYPDYYDKSIELFKVTIAAYLAAAPAAPAQKPVAHQWRYRPKGMASWSPWQDGVPDDGLPGDIQERDLCVCSPAPVASSPEAKPAPAVKALEWSDGSCSTSPTSFGMYFTGLDAGGWYWRFETSGRQYVPSPEAAKAAAQADYDRRVRACLVDGEAGGWLGPGETPHSYSPDVMAGGDDCRICGHAFDAHRLPSPPATGVE